MLFRAVFIVAFLAVVSGCTEVPDSPAYRVSNQPYVYTQQSFDAYAQETREWLMHNRAFITDDKTREVNANAPFEIAPKNPGSVTKGILLVHGLGDSPYSFVDVAPVLSEQGFLVRVILLPGHGSKPADLLWAKQRDWTEIVSHHKNLLQNEVDEVWLGGFSTGANLVTSAAIEDKSIKGLMLFSPGFESESQLIALASFASNFADWADIDPETNFVRFDSLTFNAAGEYYKTSEQVLSELNEKAFDRPAIIAMSEDDSVINAQDTLQLFEARFTHPNSKFVWYGKDPGSSDNRVEVLSSYVPEQRVSNFSHMATLFSPENSYYGINGEHRICNNGQEVSEESCLTEEGLWYSSYGYLEANKIHARLTWNPHFQHLATEMTNLVSSD